MAHEPPLFGYADAAFTPSRTRKKRKSRPGREAPSPAVLLDRTTEELTAGDWLRDCKLLLRDALQTLSFHAPEILCLGLGSPAASRDARAQLAFLLAACDDLCLDRQNVSIYDPVFTDADTQLLDTLRIRRLAENRRASYRLDAPTVVFMPHCDLVLYENLLRENWASEHLPNIVLIANRLSEYAENAPSRKFSAEHPCVWRLGPYLTSRPLPICPAYPTAFNNTSIQFVRLEDFKDVGDDWWELPSSPSAPACSSAGDPGVQPNDNIGL